MPYVMPGKGVVMSLNIKGTDFLPFLNVLRVFETVCKPYITAQVIVFDTDNLIQSLGLVAGDPASFSFLSPPNTYRYSQSMTILKMKGEPAPDTLKFQIYTIDLIGQEYWGDRLNTVRNSFQQMPGSAQIAQLWGQYIKGSSLSVDASDGMIGSQAQPHTENGSKPFTAMYNIMKMMVGGADGNWLLYRDRNNANLKQLINLLNGAKGAAQQDFVQGETWGQTFNNANIYKVVITAQMQAGRGDGGYSSGAQLAQFASQTQSVFDMGLGKILKSGMDVATTGALSALGGSQFGGRFNKQMTNSAGIENAVAPFLKTIQEGVLSSQVKNGPQIVLKVPMQTGLNVTVGKGISVALLPPTDRAISSYLLNGNWLVCDLCHEIYCDNRELNATTTMQCVKPI